MNVESIILAVLVTGLLALAYRMGYRKGRNVGDAEFAYAVNIAAEMGKHLLHATNKIHKLEAQLKELRPQQEEKQ